MKTTSDIYSVLEPFKVPFKQAVLQHIHHVLSESGWARLRRFGTDRRRSRFCDQPVPAGISPEDLIDIALEEAGLSVNEVLTSDFKTEATVIATIQRQPVYYIRDMGIYLWGERPGSSPTLHFWATFPAYPPGW